MARDMAYDPLKASDPGRGLDHPPSYWAATAGPAPDDDGPLDGDRDADIAIIGGGYTGLSCAYHLADRFGAQPVVLEANRAGWGCSGRNGSFARPALGRLKYADWVRNWGEDAARALFAEAMAGLDTVRALIRDGGIDCDAQPDGALKLAHRRNRVAELETDHRILGGLFGYRSELLDRAAIEARHFKGEEAYGALRMPDSFALHPLKLAYGLTRLARGAGAVVHRASPVTAWSKDGDRHLLQTPSGRLRARDVVVAANGYLPEHLHRSLRGRLLPVLSNIIVTRPMTPVEKSACNLVTTDVMYDTRRLLNYFRRLPDDRMMLGNRGPIAEAPAAMAAHRDILLANLKRKFPPLKDITVDYFWGGWVAVTRDSMPHVHHAEDDPSVHYALGYCGSGVSAAVHAGRRLAERLGAGAEVLLVLDRPVPRIPLAAFRRLGQRAAFLWYRFQDEWR
jgi:taurine dehydrogenase large subunit